MFKPLMLPLALLMLASCSNPAPQNTPLPDSASRKWWKEAVVYQLYPRSFKDNNGDGIGDLKGIISKLDYIKSLGVDVVWLNPIYASPNTDNGYDISDYRAIMKDFGTMSDFDTLLKEMHARHLKLVMDLVVNHTSDQNEWFLQSKSSRDNPYRNYYHWWNAERGKPTPRWSFFDVNSDAWKLDTPTNSYYLHYFSRQQPDLNWENPVVRQEVYKMMKYWLDKGIDGFRMDAFQFVAKDTTWPEFPKGYEQDIIKYYGMGAHLHDYLKEMNKDVLSKYDIMTVAEGAGSTLDDAMDLVGPDRNELNMAYHFEGMDVGKGKPNYDLLEFKKVYSKWDTINSQKGWVSVFLGNHDQPRMLSHWGSDSLPFRSYSAKMLNTFLLTMRGTPYTYYGDELGMRNIRFDKIDDYRDVATQNKYAHLKATGGNVDSFLESEKRFGRDNGRTPFQWDSSVNAGFTTGTPWLKVNPDYTLVNAAQEEKDSASVLNYFRKLIRLRKANPIFVYGAYRLIDGYNPEVYSYVRELQGKRVLVVLNFKDHQASANLGDYLKGAKLILGNYPDSAPKDVLRPYEALVLELP